MASLQHFVLHKLIDFDDSKINFTSITLLVNAVSAALLRF